METLRVTNANIMRDQRRNGGELTFGEYLKWIGIRLAMAIDPANGPTKSYWNQTPQMDNVFQSRNYDRRFEMSKNRFETIEKNLQLVERT